MSEQEEIANGLSMIAEKIGQLSAIATKLDALSTISTQLDALSTDVKSVATAKKPCDEYYQHRFDDAGEWARHYSVVRMTVTPFLLTTSLGILAFKWDRPDPTFVIASMMTWAAAMVLLTAFTYATYQKMQHQRALAAKMGESICSSVTQTSGGDYEDSTKPHWGLDLGFLLGCGLTVGYICVVGFWIADRPNKSPVDTIKVQLVGSLPTVSIAPPKEFPAVRFDTTQALPRVSVTVPTSWPKVEFGTVPSIEVKAPEQMPEIRISAPPAIPNVHFDSPPTISPIQISGAAIGQAPAANRGGLSVTDNRLEVNIPPSEAKRIHIFRFGIFGIDLIDISIPRDDPPAKNKNGGR